MAVAIQQMNIEVTEVSDVVVTTVEQDPGVGDYVRDVRIFGEGATEGGTKPLLIQLRIRAVSRDPLQITSPQTEF